MTLENDDVVSDGEKKCCICNGKIDKHYTEEGEMYWDKGHNPHPVKTGEDDRCCDKCDETVVMPIRLGEVMDRIGSAQLKSHHDKKDPFKLDIGGEG